MASRPTLRVLSGCRVAVDLRALRAKQHRVERALLKAQRAADTALREYRAAYALAVEDHAPVNDHTHGQIVDAFVSADALIRTEIALRQIVSGARPDPEPTLESDPTTVDEES